MTKINPNLILEDDRVLLRPLQYDDVENLLYISENEPETWQYSLIRANGKANLENYIDLAIKAREKQTEFPFHRVRQIDWKICREHAVLRHPLFI